MMSRLQNLYKDGGHVHSSQLYLTEFEVKLDFRLKQETVDEKSTSWRPFVVEQILSWSFFLFLDLQSKLVTQLLQSTAPRGGGGGSCEGHLGEYLLGMCRRPLRAPTPF